ncbi:hypothetical protein EN991_21465, partial [Mesorhizobium sp. M7A.F.Ca.US.005.03.2.1]
MGNQSPVKIWDLFGGSNEAHGRYTVQRTSERGKAEGKAVTEPGPATQAIWNAHLAGTGPGVGVIPIRRDGTVLWGCIDVDVIGIDHAALEQDIEDLKLPLVVSRSKSGGAHAFLFLKEPAPASAIQHYLAQCSSALGYGGCEIFPKQTAATEEQPGNWLNMPYFFADKTNRYGTHNGELLDLQTFVDFAASRRVLADELVPPRQFEPVLASERFQLPEIIEESSGPYQDSKGKDYYGRNQVLYHHGCSLRSRGADDATVASNLAEVNANRCRPPIEPRKLDLIIRQVQKLPVGEPAQSKKETIPKLPKLEPAVWPAPASIPRLDRLYGHHYVRGFVSVTAGPGGIGKSSLSQAEVVMMLAHIGMVEGRLSPRPLNVLYVNLEDDLDQIWRHFLATASHYGIDPKTLEGKLFVHSGQDQPIKIAELKKHDVRVWTELVDELIQFALANNIDVVIFDPFVSLHSV